MSRHLAQLSCADVLVHFAQDVVQLAGSDIALHLFIPFVVFPAMEPGRKFGPLFKRELFDGGLDLVNAHGLNDMQKSLSRQRANGDDGGQRSAAFALGYGAPGRTEDRGRRTAAFVPRPRDTASQEGQRTCCAFVSAS